MRTRHAGNEAAFRQYLIKLEVIEREYGETYLKARRMRDTLFDAPSDRICLIQQK